MTKSELTSVLGELGIHPSRKLGQNFLIDANLLAWTVRTAAPQPEESLLEIGPGTGTLTRQLLAAGARVTAIELDHRLAEYLRRQFADCARLRLIQADACDVDYDALMGPEPYRCIANLPYAVSSVLIAGFLEVQNPPRELYVLLQQEMADRLGANAGGKEYGALSVQAQLVYDIRALRRISPAVFYPPPEVGSAYVQFRLRAEQLPLTLRRQVRRLVQAGFSQRRKQMRKLLSGLAPALVLDAAYAAFGLPADVRAEAVPVATFVAFARFLQAHAIQPAGAPTPEA